MSARIGAELDLKADEWIKLPRTYLDELRPIGRVIGRARHRDFLGRPSETWRVRQCGFGPDADVTASAKELRKLFGAANAQRAMDRAALHMVPVAA